MKFRVGESAMNGLKGSRKTDGQSEMTVVLDDHQHRPISDILRQCMNLWNQIHD